MLIGEQRLPIDLKGVYEIMEIEPISDVKVGEIISFISPIEYNEVATWITLKDSKNYSLGETDEVISVQIHPSNENSVQISTKTRQYVLRRIL